MSTYLGCDSSRHEDLRWPILLFAKCTWCTLHTGVAAIGLDINGKLVTVHNVVSGSLILLN